MCESMVDIQSATAENRRGSLIRRAAVKARFHYASWFEAGSKLVGDQLRTSFEPANVMEFGFNEMYLRSVCQVCSRYRPRSRSITANCSAFLALLVISS